MLTMISVFVSQLLVDVSHSPAMAFCQSFPASERYCSVAYFTSYYLVTEAHVCEQLAQGRYVTASSQRIKPSFIVLCTPYTAHTRVQAVNVAE